MEAKPADADHFGVLDGLRGFAILLVLLVHSGQTGFEPALRLGAATVGLAPLIASGTLGVDIFFFLSGFVLFLPYARAMRGERAVPTIGHFIDRRIVKIVPSYYIAVIVTAYFFVQDADAIARMPAEILRHLTFVHPFWHESLYGIQGPFWSLGIEVQFYVMFPAIAACMRRQPLLTYLGLFAIGEAWRIWLIAVGWGIDVYWGEQLPAFIDLFGTGMLGAYLLVRHRDRLRDPRVSGAATAIAATACAVGIWLLNDLASATFAGGSGAHQMWSTTHRAAVEATLLTFTLASLSAKPFWRAIVANRAFVWLSIVSYNLYLWNSAVEIQCAHTGYPCSVDPTPWSTNANWSVQYFCMFIAVSITIATLMTYGVERPLMRLGTRGIWDMLRSRMRSVARTT